MGDWDRLVESCKIATGREVNDHWEVMEVVDELHNKVLELESELGRLNKPVVSNCAFKRGIDEYFDDLEKWEESFYCNECGYDKITDFAYDRTVANGEVWYCKHCKTETVAGNKPNEDRY